MSISLDIVLGSVLGLIYGISVRVLDILIFLFWESLHIFHSFKFFAVYVEL